MIHKLERIIADLEKWQHDNPAEADLVQPAKDRLLYTLRILTARRSAS